MQTTNNYLQLVYVRPTLFFSESLLYLLYSKLFVLRKTICYSRWLPPQAPRHHHCGLHCPHCCLRCCLRCCCWCREWSSGHYRLHHRRPRRRRPVVSNTPVSWAVVQWVIVSLPPQSQQHTHTRFRGDNALTFQVIYQ